MSTISDTLNKAADLIEERGIARGQFYDGDKLCMLGAISVALGGDPDSLKHSNSPEELAILTYLDLVEADLYLGSWSDAHSQGQVIGALRGAAYQAANT